MAKAKVREQMTAVMVMAMVAKAMAMAMVTRAKVRADGGNDGIQGERGGWSSGVPIRG